MLDLISFIAFLLIIAILIYLDRRKVKLEGIVLIRRTKKGRNFIDSFAKKYKSFWRYFAITGVVISILALIGITFFLFNNTFALITKQTEEGAARILLPGPVQLPVSVPGLLILPWWIWVIGVAIVMIPHEFMHGVVCRLENIRIKSVGWLLLLFIPGAFVEPDENELKKRKRITKLKVYASGSFANIIVGLCILLILNLSSPSFSQVGSSFLLIKDSPAYNASLSGSILEIDGNKIYSTSDLNKTLSAHKPNDIVEIKTAKNVEAIPIFNSSLLPDSMVAVDMKNITTHRLRLGSHPNETEKAYLGVYAQSFIPAAVYNPLVPIQNIMFWAFIFSIGIGLVNLLPIKPLDGGLILEEIIGKFIKGKKSKTIVRAVSMLLLFMLLFNVFGPIFI